MSQLENNTASLQAILDTVNNLPEATSGGGAMRVAVGTFTPTSVNLYNNPISVTGLGLEPKYVSIVAMNPTDQAYDTWTSGYRYLFVVEQGTLNNTTVDNKLSCIYTGSTYSVGSTNGTYTITRNSDGFKLSTSTTTDYVIKREHFYVALADSATVEEAVSAALEEVENGSY